ncbi:MULTISPECIES: YesL family protein [Bacillaceae]|uniref:YesL family protein n=1 Tax=Bacillaceae TaxID=186817 RepID=UPI002FFF4679
MQMGRVMGGLFTVSDWIWKLALVNILWIFFTLTGFIVLGIIPATVALFTVVRKWHMKETDIPISRIFFNTYKKEFLRANLVGLLIGAIGFFLFIDYRLVMAIGGTVQSILSILLLILIGLFLITLLYLFPVYVHFELKFFQYFKYAFYIGTLNIHITILMVAVLLLLSFPLSFFPGFIPFFSVSLMSIVMMFGATMAFKRIEKKQKKFSA